MNEINRDTFTFLEMITASDNKLKEIPSSLKNEAINIIEEIIKNLDEYSKLLNTKYNSFYDCYYIKKKCLEVGFYLIKSLGNVKLDDYKSYRELIEYCEKGKFDCLMDRLKDGFGKYFKLSERENIRFLMKFINSEITNLIIANSWAKDPRSMMREASDNSIPRIMPIRQEKIESGKILFLETEIRSERVKLNIKVENDKLYLVREPLEYSNVPSIQETNIEEKDYMSNKFSIFQDVVLKGKIKERKVNAFINTGLKYSLVRKNIIKGVANVKQRDPIEFTLSDDKVEVKEEAIVKIKIGKKEIEETVLVSETLSKELIIGLSTVRAISRCKTTLKGDMYPLDKKIKNIEINELEIKIIDNKNKEIRIVHGKIKGRHCRLLAIYALKTKYDENRPVNECSDREKGMLDKDNIISIYGNENAREVFFKLKGILRDFKFEPEELKNLINGDWEKGSKLSLSANKISFSYGFWLNHSDLLASFSNVFINPIYLMDIMKLVPPEIVLKLPPEPRMLVFDKN